MIRSMHSAASGMEAMQTQIDVIANNMANVNTVGFKKSRAEFQDLLYQQVQAASNALSSGTAPGRPAPVEIGQGTRLIATEKMFALGDLKPTNNQLDVAIEGEGFLKVRMPDQTNAYTRAGNLQVTSTGQLVTTNGHPLDPPIFVPPDSTSITIEPGGAVKALQQGNPDPQEIGKIELANFANPVGLKSLGSGLFAETQGSGRPTSGAPGENGLGTVGQGMLESSNVEVVTEMIDLIAAQRAYEMNSRVIRAADEMLGEASQIR